MSLEILRDYFDKGEWLYYYSSFCIGFFSDFSYRCMKDGRRDLKIEMSERKEAAD